MRNKLFKRVISMLMVCLIAVTSIPLTAFADGYIDNAAGNSQAAAGLFTGAPAGYFEQYGGYRFAVVAAKDSTTINGKTYSAGQVVSDEDDDPMVFDLMSGEANNKTYLPNCDVRYNKVRTSNQEFSDIPIYGDLPDVMPYSTDWVDLGGGKGYFASDGETIRNFLKSPHDGKNYTNLDYILLKYINEDAIKLLNSGTCKVVLEPAVLIPLYANYVSRGYVLSGAQAMVPTSSGGTTCAWTLSPNFWYTYEADDKMYRTKRGSPGGSGIHIDPADGFFGQGLVNSGGLVAVDFDEWDTTDNDYSSRQILTKNVQSSYSGHNYFGTIYGYLKACSEFQNMFKDKNVCKDLYPGGLSADGLNTLNFMSPIKKAVPSGFHLARDDKDFDLYVPLNPNQETTWATIGKQGYGIHIYESKPQNPVIHTYDIKTNPKDPAPAETPTDENKNKGDITIVKLYMNSWKDKSGKYMGLEPAQPTTMFTKSNTTNSIVVSDETGDNKPGYNVVSWYVSTEAPKTDLKFSDWVQFTKGEKTLKDVLAIPGINGTNGANGLSATQYYPVAGTKNGVTASSLSTGNYNEKDKK